MKKYVIHYFDHVENKKLCEENEFQSVSELKSHYEDWDCTVIGFLEIQDNPMFSKSLSEIGDVTFGND